MKLHTRKIKKTPWAVLHVAKMYVIIYYKLLSIQQKLRTRISWLHNKQKQKTN